MHETIKIITERVNFEKKDKVSPFLNRCISLSKDTTKRANAIHENVLFKADAFFEGVTRLTNELTKNQKIRKGVETLQIVLEELGFEIEKEDTFILFHLRDLGKFKITDVKLREQLKVHWCQFKEYAIDDHDFSYSIRKLMKMGLIDYRKGRLNLKQNIIITYKN